MRVAEGKWKGSRIDDLAELVGLKEDGEDVVVKIGNVCFVKPASHITTWSLDHILQTELYHALPWDPELIKKEKCHS